MKSERCKNTFVLILAGGTGKRLGGTEPKQFLDLAGKPLIERTVESFITHPGINNVMIVCCTAGVRQMKKIVAGMSLEEKICIVEGGATRQESAYIGLNNVPPGFEFVLIHDAVRPLVSHDVITRVLDGIEETGAVMPVVEATDTLVTEKAGYLDSVPERDIMRNVQTPQGFKTKIIIGAHEEAIKKGERKATDDASLVWRLGGKVKLVRGDERNIKITVKEDFLTACAYVKR